MKAAEALRAVALHNVLETVLDGFATKRITRLVVDDAILDDVRNAIFDKYDPETNKLAYLITCHACSSIWAAGIVRSGVLPRWTRDILALSEIALAIKRLVDD